MVDLHIFGAEFADGLGFCEADCTNLWVGEYDSGDIAVFDFSGGEVSSSRWVGSAKQAV